jgi:hypothetical protein
MTVTQGLNCGINKMVIVSVWEIRVLLEFRAIKILTYSAPEIDQLEFVTGTKHQETNTSQGKDWSI